MRKVHNKLVRDGIVAKIEKNGETAGWHKATATEFIKASTAKVLEEAHEFAQNPSLSEAADILEILYARMELEGVTPADIEAERLRLAKEKGGFSDHIILEYTE